MLMKNPLFKILITARKMPKCTLLLVLFVIGVSIQAKAQSVYRIGKMKYGGGGDWYCNKTSLPNLIAYCNKELNTRFEEEAEVVEPGSPAMLQLPIVHLTGHGNILFTASEAEGLRKYLQAGGFLHADDNYGLDKFFRREMKKVFPELDFVELPFSHPIYHQKYDFAAGLPKVHEHDGKPPRGYGLFYKGRLICFYSYECDLGNGWEDRAVYNDAEATRLKALQMGANIVAYALAQP
jgi:hypothetical protein